MRLCIFKWYYLSCTVILGSFLGIFRHIRALFKSILAHIQNYLYPWHIQDAGIFLSQNIYRLQGIFILPYYALSQKLHLGRLIQF